MVEGDQALCAAVDIHLRQQGYTVDYAHTGEDGLHFALQNAYDLILMDRMLPELDGLEAVRTLRSRGFSTPVLMLTALDGVPDRVDGLDAGADDYPAKPFAAEELLARIRALSRRPRQWESTSRLSRRGSGAGYGARRPPQARGGLFPLPPGETASGTLPPQRRA